MSADQQPPTGPPPGPPVNPYDPSGRPHQPPSTGRYHWALILLGVPIGFVLWVVVSFVVILGTSFGDTTSAVPQAAVIGLLAALLAVAVGLIVWRRSRQLGQGIILGIAIGMIVGGGLCLPIVLSG
ncbi:hypothetical protein [Oryzobacter telluris]|uniref:hypothetical protein n=1 Tax=Oryzobacter telluris TaxID=3149179 RepID=UPI00370DDD3F